MPRPTKLRGRQPAGKPPRAAQHAADASAGGATGLPPEIRVRLDAALSESSESDRTEHVVGLAAETPGGLLALIDALGAGHDEAAGQVLAALATAAPDKDARKAARRALHRLRSAGVVVAVPVPAEPVPATAGSQDALRPVQTLASTPDGSGSRVLWLLLERPHGGLTMFYFALNDVVGLRDFRHEDTTRRRVDRRLADWDERAEPRPTELPLAYGLSLISEALELNRESGVPLPRDFVIRRQLLGELPPPPITAPIHQHVSRGQIFLLPNLLEESAGLLERERELSDWRFSDQDAAPYAREYQAIGQSRLLLTSEPREARLGRIVDNALDALMTPPLRRAYRRRLEEIAYVFWQSGRDRSARQAVAAAFAIPDAGSLRSHPLLRAIIMRSIEMATEADRLGAGAPPDDST